jgi:RNA polymerase sigma factor (sigma-70 family)
LDREEDRPDIVECLRALRSEAPAEAWADFLVKYSPIILQVAGLFENDADKVADCFVFACEQLSKNRFRRLHQFKPDGTASFATWLRAVIRRLCIDWHRSEFGRSRIFDSIGRLSSVDQAVFRAIYEDGEWTVDALESLRARFPEFTREKVEESCARIQQSLSPRQLWLLSTRKPKVASLDGVFVDDRAPLEEQIRDLAPDPETLAVEREQRAALERALSGLPASDRLLIRLRFEQELTLEQVARLTSLPDPQTADRRLKEILAGLRKTIGKRQPASV